MKRALEKLYSLEHYVKELRPHLKRDFEGLAEPLETTRDMIRDHLNPMSQAERHAAERQISPRVNALCDRVHGMVHAAHSGRVIPGHLAADLLWIALSLRFCAGMITHFFK